jgi:hypothetical protein
MRFVISISLLVAIFAGSTISFAQSMSISEPASRSFTPRMYKGKQVDSLQPRDGFSLEFVETGLGNISTLSIREDGTVFSADAETGRIWQLSDRNQDGRVDIKRALAHRFDRPTGLAVSDEALYVADRAAVWVINEGQPPRKLAGLIKANSTDAFHPLSLSSDKKSLFLGLTTKEGVSNILLIDQNTGQAELVDSLPASEQIRAIASLGNKVIWSITENGVGAALSNLTKTDDSLRLTGMTLPQGNGKWPLAYSQHAIISKHSADGYAVLALPAAMSTVETKGDVLLSGFLSTSGRSAWGRPGALSFDKHGLLIADDYNGDLYRLRAIPSIKAEIEPQLSPENTNESLTTSDKHDLPSTLLSTITGSQIDKASGIDSATTLETGSTILRDYKPLEIEDRPDSQSLDKKKPN